MVVDELLDGSSVELVPGLHVAEGEDGVLDLVLSAPQGAAPVGGVGRAGTPNHANLRKDKYMLHI